MPFNLKNILSGGIPDIVNSAKNLISQFKLSPEQEKQFLADFEKEANRHMEALEANVLKQQELENADRSSARDANAKIQESEHAGWLAKNTAYILDFVFVIAFIIMLAMIFYKVVPQENKELFYMAFGLLGANVGNVINFHRGSSKGSEEKQKSLERMARKV